MMSSSSASAKVDPLDPSAVLETLTRLLPRDASSQTPSSSSSAAGSALRTPQDGLAALLHAALTRLDFRLVGLAEDDRISDYEQASGETKSSSVQNALPPQAWSRNGPESYTLRYRHDQSSLTFLLKLLRMSSRVLIHASAVEDNKTATLEIPIADYTSASFFPYPAAEASSESSTTNNGSSASEPLVNGFVSSSRVKDLLLLFKGKIIQKLIPGLRKDGYEESSSEQGAEASSSAPRASQQQPPPRRPIYDPDEDFHPPAGGGGVGGVPMPGRNPLSVGDRDLLPLGGMQPPGAGGSGGFGPPPLFGGGAGGGLGGMGGGGGMFVGPDDPIFRDRFGQGGGGGGGGGGGVGPGGQPRGPWGGDGFLPPGAVPPGARFDPVGPWGSGPGAGRGPGGPGPGRGGGFGGPPGARTGDPDWDDVRPPGGSSDYDNMFM